MREIPAVDRDGNVALDLPSIVFAILRFGDDQHSLWSSLNSIRFEAVSGISQRGIGFISKFLLDEFAGCASRGAIAGDVFLNLISLHIHRPEHASVNKAIYLKSMDIKSSRLHDGSHVSLDRRKVIKCWSEFKTRAHIWAAINAFLVPQYGDLFSADKESNYQHLTRVYAETLLASEALAVRAIENDLVDKWDPWLLPRTFPGSPVSIDVPDLSDEAVGYLAAYKASMPT
jgi:hypothetical protein